MNHADVLPTLLVRLAAASGEAALLSERELSEWPAAAVAQLKAERLLVNGPPADAVTCPGCEEDCTMPVEVDTTASGAMRAFVLCDKRDDVGRVAVAADLLVQWTCSPERVADVLAQMLNIRRSSGDSTALRWDVGVLKGAKGSSHVVLDIERTLQLRIAGHSLPVADALDLGEKGLVLERRALVRCVDNPIAAAGDQESAEQRRERLRKRRNELKAQGEHHYNKALAAEEGVTVGRIKQLLKEEKEEPAPATSWLDPFAKSKGTTQKKPKPQR
ncbi:MAG: hypothetical protein ACYCWC_09520 [Rhodocyclaceae bacterium]